MNRTIFFILIAPFAGASEPTPPAVVVSTTVSAVANSSVRMFPPKVPARPKGTLDTAADVARDLALRVEYFENGQSYYRAYTKGSHTADENKAFVQFLEEYENELAIARRVHALLGVWLEKKSSVKD